MKSFGEQYISDQIYKRLNGLVPSNILRYIMIIIGQYLIDQIKEDKFLTIKNFGTFSKSYTVNRVDGDPTKEYKRIKLLPCSKFLQTIQIRKKFLASKKEENDG